MAKPKILRDYAKYTDEKLAEFVLKIKAWMTGNANFTTPAISMAQLGNVNTTFTDAIVAADDGSEADTANKSAVRASVITVLDTEADYVELASNGDAAKILSSGFTLASVNRTQSQLETPSIDSVTNFANTKLKLVITPVANARAYEVAISTAPNVWQLWATFPSTRNTILEGLTPGTTYSIRVRGVGGSTGHSEWSEIATHMST